MKRFLHIPYSFSPFAALYIGIYLFFITISAHADHIVGGNIEMIALDKTPGRYKVVVKIYYDRLKVSSTLYAVPLTIYRKSDKKEMLITAVPRIDSKRQPLQFTNAKCAEQNRLEIIFDYFEKEITLDPSLYNDPNGYVLVWNECCRSREITNIQFPELRGLPFYTEFPPLTKNGKPFVDSTPEFDEIDGEYVCLGDNFTYSFDATDRDGDELRYALVTPLSFYDFDFARNIGLQSGSRPVIITEYIEWKPGYSAANAIRGNPPLTIDPKTGELSVNANEVGLFAFTVLVEEYRNGERIGATRRDYQLFVFDCPPIIPPDPTITINNQPATEASACLGGNVLLQATYNSNWKYQWKKDNNNLPNDTTATLSVTQSGIYQLITYLDNQCSKTRRSRKIKVDFTSSNFKLKSNSPLRICTNGGQIMLESPQNANYAYEWYKDGVLVPAASQATYTATEAGRYWAVLRDVTQGCTSRSDTLSIQAVVPTVVNIANSSGGQICAGTSTTLSVTNNAIKSFQWIYNGKDLLNETKNNLTVSQAGEYNVTVVDTSGCQATSASVKINVISKITVTLDSLPNFCGADHPAITLKGEPVGGIYTGKGVLNSQFDPKKAGVGTHIITYSIKGELACQSGQAVRSLVITPPPVLNLGRDREIFKGASIELNGDLGNSYIYNWSPTTALSNPSGAITNSSPESTTTYQLTALGPGGCKASDSITVRVITTIYIPDAFTPNSDGINDVWKLTGIENYPDIEVTIFNRWGNIVFYKKGSNQPFFDGTRDGEVLPVGVYAYVIKTNDTSGYIFRGAVTLLK